MSSKRLLAQALVLAFILITAAAASAQSLRLGTWKTAQIIQPFFYQQFLPDASKAQVFTFTNPADQKTALLAGSLDICGTTLAILQKAAPNMELAWSMDENFVAQTRALGQRMQALGVIRQQPDYNKLFDLSFVRKVKQKLAP